MNIVKRTVWTVSQLNMLDITGNSHHQDSVSAVLAACLRTSPADSVTTNLFLNNRHYITTLHVLNGLVKNSSLPLVITWSNCSMVITCMFGPLKFKNQFDYRWTTMIYILLFSGKKTGSEKVSNYITFLVFLLKARNSFF